MPGRSFHVAATILKDPGLTVQVAPMLYDSILSKRQANSFEHQKNDTTADRNSKDYLVER